MRQPGSPQLGPVCRVAAGNFLEMYDFFVFGFYAGPIGQAFFPAHDPFVSLMASLATFWAAFLMRPLGALVLGGVLDRIGRRRGLLLTLGLMSAGVVMLTLTPPYARIGWAAPVLVLCARLLQGFSAGVELGGVSVYLAEMAPPGRRGLFVSAQSASQQVAVVFAAALGALLSAVLPHAAVPQWGWRIAFLVGCLIAPLLFWLRRGLVETEAFQAQETHPTSREILRTLRAHWALILSGAGLVSMTTVSFYLITVYTPTFGRHELHLSDHAVFVVTVCVGLSNLLWLPIGGALSDRIGRVPILGASAGLMLFAAYPMLAWVVSAPGFGRLLAVELVLSLLYGFYNGAMVVHLAELVPARVRSSGFSLAYSLAVAIFGGATPVVCTGLIHLTGNRAIPGLWAGLAAAIALASLFATTRLKASGRTTF